jgi:hypothetical protein
LAACYLDGRLEKKKVWATFYDPAIHCKSVCSHLSTQLGLWNDSAKALKIYLARRLKNIIIVDLRPGDLSAK